MKSKEMGVILNIIADLWPGQNRKLSPTAKTLWQRALSPLDFSRVKDTLDSEYMKDPNKLPKINVVLEKSKAPAQPTGKPDLYQQDANASNQTIEEAEKYLRRMSKEDLDMAESMAKGCPILSALVKRRWSNAWVATVYNTAMEIEEL